MIMTSIGNFLSLMLFLGKHDGRTTKLLLESMEKSVLERLTSFVSNKPFKSLLTHGSQARKTGDDKEMMLVQVEKDGKEVIHTYTLFILDYTFYL